MALNAADAYRQQAIQTNNPSRLLLLVFDGAISTLNRANTLIEEKNIPEAHNHILKVQDLIGELIVALDFQYEISNNLADLYHYMIDRLVEANIKKDQEIINEVLDMLTEMREMWKETSKLANQGTSPKPNSPAAEPVAAAPAGGFNITG